MRFLKKLFGGDVVKKDLAKIHENLEAITKRTDDALQKLREAHGAVVPKKLKIVK